MDSTFIVTSTLDPTKMENEFAKLRKRLQGWSLLGLAKDSKSCASLAGRLLQVGGIDKLINIVETTIKEVTEVSRGSYKSTVHGAKVSQYAVLSKEQDALLKAREASKATSFYTLEMGVGRVIESPDHLAKLLQIAVDNERSKHPYTKDFFAQESSTTKTNEGTPSLGTGM